MRRRLPPMEQIEAFIEAARAPTFREAAERCALSPAAFSRRVQALATSLQRELFERHSRGRRLTEAGLRTLEELEPAYLELRRVASVMIDDEPSEHRVRLSVAHALAVGWLVRRMRQFEEAHPNIELAIRTHRDASAVRRGACDMGLFFMDVETSGLLTQPIMHAAIMPVASPRMVDAFRAENSDLNRFPLLSLLGWPDLWRWWGSAVGYEVSSEPKYTFDMAHIMFEAACRGAGIAMGATPLISPYLEAGTLVKLDLPIMRVPDAYRLASSPKRRKRPAVVAVWEWLLAEARTEPEVT